MSPADLVAAADGDVRVLWAGQGLKDRNRAWCAGDAVAVVAPELNRHDRIVVKGPIDDVAPLVRGVLGIVGPTYRPFGAEPLIREVVERIPELSLRATFGWMETDEPPAETVTARWLADDAGVAELLEEASPTSYAWPGAAGVTRWAGIEASEPSARPDGADLSAPEPEQGRLLSVAADAWSAPEVGFIAGVATLPSARGRGLSRQVCAFVTTELVKRHGRVGLMVDGGNETAIGLYRTLGYSYHPVGVAQL
nr:GNAT family N-acetyltransferase [Kribbella italica]